MPLPILLLVDDNEEIITYLSALLEETYQLRVAGNGMEAIEVLNKEPIDLVVCDIMMPVMDGFALCRQIKTSAAISHVPIVLLTAKNTIQSKIEGLQLGADAYIEKPFSPDHLKAQISNLLESRKQLRVVFAAKPLTPAVTVAHTNEDARFLERISAYIFESMENEELDTDALSEEMNMSRMTLYRKLKAITDMPPHEFINVMRLKKSAEILSEGNHKIYEVASMVGYKSTTHFGKLFYKQFGLTPTQFMQNSGAK